jgi:DNA-binding MarR family transcriptional regulator
MEKSVNELDRTIHEPSRLRIMAALMALRPSEKMGFVTLREMLELTDGNLGAHLLKLEEAGYVAVEKAFVARKPQTSAKLTPKGRQAFESYVAALKGILEGEERR